MRIFCRRVELPDRPIVQLGGGPAIPEVVGRVVELIVQMAIDIGNQYRQVVGNGLQALLAVAQLSFDGEAFSDILNDEIEPEAERGFANPGVNFDGDAVAMPIMQFGDPLILEQRNGARFVQPFEPLYHIQNGKAQ